MIEVNNLTTSKVDESFIKKIADKVLKGELVEISKYRNIELSIAIIGSSRMRKLNKKYQGKNKVTDVLAFAGGLGEIVICLPVLKKNAKRFNISFEKELARVLIHGVLHLLGYDHERSAEEARKMKEKEEYYLKKIL